MPKQDDVFPKELLVTHEVDDQYEYFNGVRNPDDVNIDESDNNTRRVAVYELKEIRQLKLERKFV